MNWKTAKKAAWHAAPLVLAGAAGVAGLGGFIPLGAVAAYKYSGKSVGSVLTGAAVGMVGNLAFNAAAVAAGSMAAPKTATAAASGALALAPPTGTVEVEGLAKPVGAAMRDFRAWAKTFAESGHGGQLYTHGQITKGRSVYTDVFHRTHLRGLVLGQAARIAGVHDVSYRTASLGPAPGDHTAAGDLVRTRVTFHPHAVTSGVGRLVIGQMADEFDPSKIVFAHGRPTDVEEDVKRDDVAEAKRELELARTRAKIASAQLQETRATSRAPTVQARQHALATAAEARASASEVRIARRELRRQRAEAKASSS